MYASKEAVHHINMTDILTLDTMNSSAPVGNLTDAFDSDWRNIFYTYAQPGRIVLICIYVPVFIVAFFGNLMVLLVLLVNKRMRSVTNYFLVNLAVADMFVTIFCIPMTAAQSVYTVWLYGEFMCRFTGFMQGLSIGASVLTILCMSVDRYMAISYPMRNRQLFTETRVKWLIVATWILAAVSMTPLMVVRKLVEHKLVIYSATVHFCHESWPSQIGRQLYDVFLLFFIYVIPGAIVVCLYAKVGVRLWHHDSHLGADNSTVNNKSRILIGRRRIARMMLIVSVLFAVCWLPYFIVTICIDFNTIKVNNTVLEIYLFTVLLGHSNSAQNPILYCSMHKGFKAFLQHLLRCQLKQLRHYRQEYGSCRLQRREAFKGQKSRGLREECRLPLQSRTVLKSAQ